MACACKGRRSKQYIWTDGTDTVIYSTEIEAKAKVMRKGGSYTVKQVS